MTFDEFVATLDKKNPWYEGFVMGMKTSNKLWADLLARKGSNLVEIVEDFRKQGRFPLVDKKLKMVFGVNHHLSIRVDLYRYHDAARNPAMPYINPHHAADSWLFEGMGYYVSSMPPHGLVVGSGYRPDRFDKDLFQIYDALPTM